MLTARALSVIAVLALAASACSSPSSAYRGAPTKRSARVPAAEPMSGEAYEHRADNPELSVAQAPLSTFSIDVDTASLSNMRRSLHSGALPEVDAVRIEELVNYYRYEYAEPEGDAPVAVTTEVAPSPFHDGRLIATAIAK